MGGRNCSLCVDDCLRPARAGPLHAFELALGKGRVSVCPINRARNPTADFAAQFELCLVGVSLFRSLHLKCSDQCCPLHTGLDGGWQCSVHWCSCCWCSLRCCCMSWPPECKSQRWGRRSWLGMPFIWGACICKWLDFYQEPPTRNGLRSDMYSSHHKSTAAARLRNA